MLEQGELGTDLGETEAQKVQGHAEEFCETSIELIQEPGLCLPLVPKAQLRQPLLPFP